MLPGERSGTVDNVVFPTGIDRRDDLGSPDRFDVYYGMAGCRVGVARLDLPESLPAGGVASRRKENVRIRRLVPQQLVSTDEAVRNCDQPSMISSNAAILIVAKVEKVSEIA